MSAVSISERYNASTLLDDNLEAGRGEKVAILWGDRGITYRELFERTCQTAGALSHLGLGVGDRVLLLLDDGLSFPAVFLGALRLGAIPIPLNPYLRPDEYPYFVTDSGAKLMILDPARVPDVAAKLASAFPTLRLLTAGTPTEGPEDLDAIVADQASEIPPADTARDDEAFWLYSSGSTGRPKGVVHKQQDMLYTCETYGRHVLGITDRDITFSSTKLFHAYGLGNNLSFPYSAGATSVLLTGRPTPDALFDVIERNRPTLFFSVPTLYNAMVKSEAGTARDLSSVRACVSAAEPLPPDVWHKWKGSFGLPILDGIGSTEMLHIYCSNTVNDCRPGSSGRVVPGYEVKILGEDLNEVEGQEAGNMWVRGGSRFAYYWSQPEKTAASITEDWFFSGDRYRRDEDGYYFYEGRADDMFKVSGLWVSPIDVENLLIEHPAVAEVAVIGAQREGFTSAKAFVVARDPSTAGEALEAELLAYCEGRLHGYQRPRLIEFVDELPKTLTGKIQRFKLRERER
jgi:benzoate-CoA ligase family protein